MTRLSTGEDSDTQGLHGLKTWSFQGPELMHERVEIKEDEGDKPCSGERSTLALQEHGKDKKGGPDKSDPSWCWASIARGGSPLPESNKGTATRIEGLGGKPGGMTKENHGFPSPIEETGMGEPNRRHVIRRELKLLPMGKNLNGRREDALFRNRQITATTAAIRPSTLGVIQVRA